MQLPDGLTLTIEDDPAEAEFDRLADGLEVFNEECWPGHQPWQRLGIFLRRDGIVGGLAAETYAGWLFIRYFWIEARYRGLGLGRSLIGMAEERARRRGCHSAYVDTFSFQAPEFYRGQGYAEFGRLPYPPQGERIFLRKRLTEDAP